MRHGRRGIDREGEGPAHLLGDGDFGLLHPQEVIRRLLELKVPAELFNHFGKRRLLERSRETG
jgi:hypothetical protein